MSATEKIAKKTSNGLIALIPDQTVMSLLSVTFAVYLIAKSFK
jgi:hypothetical protein